MLAMMALRKQPWVVKEMLKEKVPAMTTLVLDEEGLDPSLAMVAIGSLSSSSFLLLSEASCWFSRQQGDEERDARSSDLHGVGLGGEFEGSRSKSQVGQWLEVVREVKGYELVM